VTGVGFALKSDLARDRSVLLRVVSCEFVDRLWFSENPTLDFRLWTYSSCFIFGNLVDANCSRVRLPVIGSTVARRYRREA
jgi:hypothetical protein